MKTYALIIDQRALDDIQTAVSHYSELYGNLVEKFLNQLAAALDRIKQNPFYQIKYGNIRSLRVKKFPYTIHYSINETFDEINILAVIHTASDPDKIWMWREDE